MVIILLVVMLLTPDTTLITNNNLAFYNKLSYEYTSVCLVMSLM